jgi:hypothetical protein
MKRDDFKEEVFDELIRTALIDQLEDFESTMDEDSIRDTTLVEAFRRVIAYNSVPGTYMGGNYDQ